MVLDHKRISYDIEQCQESDSSQLLVCFYLPSENNFQTRKDKQTTLGDDWSSK